MTIIIRKFGRSPRKGKKYRVVIYDPDEKRKKTIHFGASGMRDYPLMNNPKSRFYLESKRERDDVKRDYISRHRPNENWTDPFAGAGIWSRYILWSKPTIEEALRLMMRKFNMKME